MNLCITYFPVFLPSKADVKDIVVGAVNSMRRVWNESCSAGFGSLLVRFYPGMSQMRLCEGGILRLGSLSPPLPAALCRELCMVLIEL